MGISGATSDYQRATSDDVCPPLIRRRLLRCSPPVLCLCEHVNNIVVSFSDIRTWKVSSRPNLPRPAASHRLFGSFWIKQMYHPLSKVTDASFIPQRGDLFTVSPGDYRSIWSLTFFLIRLNGQWPDQDRCAILIDPFWFDCEIWLYRPKCRSVQVYNICIINLIIIISQCSALPQSLTINSTW